MEFKMYKFRLKYLFLVIFVSVVNFTVPMVDRACDICLGQQPAANFHQFGCGHSFCQGCVGGQLDQADRDQSLIPLRCLDHACQARFTDADLDNLAFAAPLAPLVRQIKNRKKDILNLDKKRSGEDVDIRTRIWMYFNTQDCPNCHYTIQKNEGCNHMTCKKCAHEFCWICLGNWKTKTGGFTHIGNYTCLKNPVKQYAPFIAAAALVAGTIGTTSLIYKKYQDYKQKQKESKPTKPKTGATSAKVEDYMQKLKDKDKNDNSKSTIIPQTLFGLGVFGVLQTQFQNNNWSQRTNVLVNAGIGIASGYLIKPICKAIFGKRTKPQIKKAKVAIK